MKVHVTPKHINQGSKFNCESCPVALALREATKKWVRVYGSQLNVGHIIYKTPDIVISFLTDFDSGRDVKPFSFELEVG